MFLCHVSLGQKDCDIAHAVRIDMRHGLSESRIRQIRQMPDGRMAIATTNTIDIFDGIHFTGYELPPQYVYPLPDFHGERQLTCDTLGYVWLRYKRRLYVLDTKRGQVVADVGSLMRKLSLTDSEVVAWRQDTVPGNIHIRDASSYAVDSYGGTWIGTMEQGIIYINPRRQSRFHVFPDSAFIYARQPDYRTPHSSELAAEYSAGLTNCALDLDSDYVYIGTRQGLMIFDSSNKLVATLDERDGLSSRNVQAMIDDKNGDIWLATVTGLSRIHALGRDSFSITSYGLLDGIDLSGREFRTGQMYADADGTITVGYASGIIIFHPDSMTVPCYTFHYPRTTQDVAAEYPDRLSWWSLIIAIGLLLAALVYDVLRRSNRSKQLLGNASLSLSNQALERLKGASADELFLAQLKEIVETNISDEKFTVHILSKFMAMDRTGLYRRMQALINMSPSDYIKAVRMNVAEQLLRETSLSIAEIALRTGFSSTRYFSRVIKEYFGVSPTELRTKQIKNPSVV
jgi:AraC-like DNA-binding protein